MLVGAGFIDVIGNQKIILKEAWEMFDAQRLVQIGVCVKDLDEAMEYYQKELRNGTALPLWIRM